jgi:hypothetical protein
VDATSTSHITRHWRFSARKPGDGCDDEPDDRVAAQLGEVDADLAQPRRPDRHGRVVGAAQRLHGPAVEAARLAFLHLVGELDELVRDEQRNERAREEDHLGCRSQGTRATGRARRRDRRSPGLASVPFTPGS